MRRRIIGIENEFGFMFHDRENDFSSPYQYSWPPGAAISDMLRAILRHAAQNVRGAFYVDIYQSQPVAIEHTRYSAEQNRLWLPNGGCVYIDLNHPEYASPEAASVLDAVLYNKAGELICAGIFDTIESYKESEPNKQIVLIKNNVASAGEEQSFGCHENYSTYCTDFPTNTEFKLHMVPFLLTRQIFGGSGWHTPAGSFVYSQRTPFIQMVRGRCTQQGGDAGYNTMGVIYNSRAILNTKSTATTILPSGERICRLHLIMGDANMLEFALFLNLGTTALVVSMFEDGIRLNLEVMHATDAMQRISAQMDCQSPLIARSKGRRISALDVQFAYLEAAEIYVNQTEFVSEAQKAEFVRVVEFWRMTLEALRDEDYQWLEGRIDWATKKRIIEDYIGRKNITDDETALAKARELSVAYHIITPPFDGIQQFVKQRWPERRLLSDADLLAGTNTPPQNTRALLRSRFTEFAQLIAQAKNNAEYKRLLIAWEHVVYKNTPAKLKNPFSAENEDLEMLLQEMEQDL